MAFSWLFIDRTALEMGWDGGWHAANGHRSDANPGPLQRGQSICTWVACSTNWVTGTPKINIFSECADVSQSVDWRGAWYFTFMFVMLLDITIQAKVTVHSHDLDSTSHILHLRTDSWFSDDVIKRTEVAWAYGVEEKDVPFLQKYVSPISVSPQIISSLHLFVPSSMGSRCGCGKE